MDRAATREDSPASLPGLRARAAAARALARHGEAVGAVAPGTLDALVAALALPAPVPVARTRAEAVRHLLTLASPERYPGGVLPAVWARFCAHTHLLALTGAREDVCAHLELAAVDAAPGTGRLGGLGEHHRPVGDAHLGAGRGGAHRGARLAGGSARGWWSACRAPTPGRCGCGCDRPATAWAERCARRG